MKNKFRIKSFKNQLTAYSLSIVALMAILSIFSLSFLGQYKNQFHTMFNKHLLLANIQGIMNDMDENLLGFLTTKSSTRLNNYNKNIQELYSVLPTDLGSLYDSENIMMTNVEALAKSYIEVANQAVMHKRQRNVNEYYQLYQQCGKIKGYMEEYVKQLNTMQLSMNSKLYEDVVSLISLLQSITVSVIIILILLSLIVVYLISAKMAKPFAKLSKAAEEISSGNFDIGDLKVYSEDELQLLANTFNRMKNSIKTYIDELNEKAETENRLKDEQLKRMRMEHLLDNARLYALQSQINPHFLFNTINAAVQMSIMERAPQTGAFLENMSSLFRYNIKEMDSVCTLGEEVKNIEDYYKLLKVRFGKRITFKLEIDDETLNTKVPPLILQPLVENSYVHGLSSLEEGGEVSITTCPRPGYTEVIIADNGVGMSEEEIKRIMNNDSQYQGKGAGIGLRNVRDRLNLFYHHQDTFTMEGELGIGVKITLKLYTNVEEDTHV